MRIISATTSADMAEAKTLFLEDAAEQKLDLSFQSFEEELDKLPGGYAPPDGRLFLAQDEAQIAGCVALHSRGHAVREMKPLYVRPAFRGQGEGRDLAVTIIGEARRIGYALMRLDTLDSMQPALALYESLGFRPIEAYRHNPLSGAIYMELEIISSSADFPRE